MTSVPVLSQKPGQLWTPLQLIANAFFWYDANDITTVTKDPVTNLVSQWRDKSGNNRHLAQATAGFQPLYRPNGIGTLPAMAFGNTECLERAADTLSQPATLIAMIRTSPSTAAPYPILFDGALAHSGNRAIFFLRNADATFNNRAALAASATSPRLDPGSLAASTIFLLSGIWNGASSRISNTILNTNTGDPGTEMIVGGYTLGGDPTNVSLNMDARVGEILMFNTNLSDVNRELVEGYLAWRWNAVAATLPVGHPYFAAPPLI